MDMQFLEETKMLNYQSVGIQKLISEKRWGELSEFDKIKAIYGFVQNEIPLGYNRNDTTGINGRIWTVQYKSNAFNGIVKRCKYSVPYSWI